MIPSESKGNKLVKDFQGIIKYNWMRSIQSQGGLFVDTNPIKKYIN